MIRAMYQFHTVARNPSNTGMCKVFHPMPISIQSYLPAMRVGVANYNSTLIVYAEPLRAVHGGVGHISVGEIDVPFEAMRVLDNAVHRNQQYKDAEIDLSPEGQAKITREWLKLGDLAESLSGVTQALVCKKFLEAVLEPL